MKDFSIFVLDVDGRPTLASSANDIAHARTMLDDGVLKEDLSLITASGSSLCHAKSVFRVRPASSAEIRAFHYACKRMLPWRKPTMALLIAIDHSPYYAVTPPPSRIPAHTDSYSARRWPSRDG